MEERSVGDDPSFVELGDQVFARHPDVVEENFVKAAIAGHLHQRTHGDSGRVHVDHDVRNAAMLGRLGVGAHQAEHHVCVLRARGPDFLAVDDELVADDFRARFQRSEIGARAGLRISLAPDFFGGENFRQVALFLFLVAPRNKRRPEHAEPRPADVVRRLGAHHLVVDDRLAHGIHRLPAVFLRPCERDVTGLVQAALPRLGPREPGLIFATLAMSERPLVGMFSSSQLRTLSRNASSSGVNWRSM